MNTQTSMINFQALRDDFPILKETNRGKPLVYLDSAASAQKPFPVIDAMSCFYLQDYANIHRGIYELSERATKVYEDARETIKNFIHAKHAEEIVFVRGTTEGINLVAQSLGQSWQAGDEVILTMMEHHSNLVPWYLLQQQIGIQLKIVPLTDRGELDVAAYTALFSSRTKMVAMTHASNVLGTINPIQELTHIAHTHEVPVLIDGAQAVPHMPIDVEALGCDFYVFSSHKLYGPSGIGVLYAKKAWLNRMPPYQGGGDMIETVSFSKENDIDHVLEVKFAKPPQKFEAGTPDIGGAAGFSAAVHYLQAISMQQVYLHEQALLQYAEAQLLSVPGLRIIGTAASKVGVISLVIDGIHPHDIGTVLDHEGIAVRAGHHCAMPLMASLQLPATIRVSFGIYNHEKEIDVLVEALLLAKRLLG